MGLLTCIGVLVPTNIFVYATSDTSYVEEVSSTIDVSIEQSRNENTAQEKSEISETVVVDIAEVLGMQVPEEDTTSLVFGKGSNSNADIVYQSKESEEKLNKKFEYLDEITSVELGNSTIVKIATPTPTPTATPMPTATPTPTPLIESTIQNIDQSRALIRISNPDPNYIGAVINLSVDDRYVLEMLVMGEAEGEGLEGAALVAQTIRDTMVYKGYNSVSAIRNDFGYSKNMIKAPNQNVKDAVAYIFDQGGCAVQHRIYYFYAPARVSSDFHERQELVIIHGGHKFFDEW